MVLLYNVCTVYTHGHTCDKRMIPLHLKINIIRGEDLTNKCEANESEKVGIINTMIVKTNGLTALQLFFIASY